eukprot:CAMPEP_0171705262 /NCGR_PEP_ID=MMETSP0991-20121206/13097_1 /TAXON_ID=483369 /ORGANISM="non described non described, Strain CCMP2098" /LENGTH=88 /DNA_ID=CAMNT_0012294783 /DNA_START=55 /DNA_END=321 /DNA_ORIENTATION=-
MPSEAAMKFKPAVRASIQMMKIVNLAVGALSPQLANVLKLVEVPKGFLDKFGEAEANKLKWDIILEKMRDKMMTRYLPMKRRAKHTAF